MPSLKQLVEAINNALKTRGVNDIKVNGYPLIHYMTMQIEKYPEENRYFSLLEQILSFECNSNIYDKHGSTPIQAVLCEFANAGNLKRCFKLLCQHGGSLSINTLSGKSSFRKIMEHIMHAIETQEDFEALIKEEKEIIGFLCHIILKLKITPQIRYECNELFERAVEERNPFVIDFLIEHGLASLSQVPSKFTQRRKGDELEFYKGGCWLRIVKNPKREIQILRKREGLPKERLLGHMATKTTEDTYTEYSPAAFIIYDVPVYPFMAEEGVDPDSIGVFIKNGSDLIVPYWYDGFLGQHLTEDMDFSDIELHNPELRGYGGEYNNIRSEEIPHKIKLAYSIKIGDFARRKDNHGVLDNIPYRETAPLNEGLFRYKRDDIIGIFVNPKSPRSIHEANRFKEYLGLKEVPFFHYSCSDGLTHVSTPACKQDDSVRSQAALLACERAKTTAKQPSSPHDANTACCSHNPPAIAPKLANVSIPKPLAASRITKTRVKSACVTTLVPPPRAVNGKELTVITANTGTAQKMQKFGQFCSQKDAGDVKVATTPGCK